MDMFQKNDKWEDINAILALTEFGLTRQDVSIHEYVERAIRRMNCSTKCAKILFLRNLIALGYIEHEWVQKEIELAVNNIREDGSVRCLDFGKKRNDSRLPEMGCYRQMATYLLLAAELKKLGITYPQYDRLLEFYRNHNVIFHMEHPKKVIIKEMLGTFYPIDHVHIGLHMIMYGLFVLYEKNHMNYTKAWEILQNNRDSEGKYILSESFEKPYFEVGSVGEPNKWVTLYCMLAEKNINKK